MMETRRPRMTVISEVDSGSGDSSVFRPSYEGCPWSRQSAVDDERNARQQIDSLLPPVRMLSNKPRQIYHSKSMVNNIATWLGVNDKDVEERKLAERWKEHVKRRRSNNRLVGQYKDEVIGDDVFDGSTPSVVVYNKSANTCQVVDPLSRPMANRQLSKISTSSSRRTARQHNPIRMGAKESVFKMAYNGIKQAVTPSIKSDVTHPLTMHSRSISMHQIKMETPNLENATMSNNNNDDINFVDDVFFNEPTPTTIYPTSIYRSHHHGDQHHGDHHHGDQHQQQHHVEFASDHPLSHQHIDYHNHRQECIQKLKRREEIISRRRGNADDDGDADDDDNDLKLDGNLDPNAKLQTNGASIAFQPMNRIDPVIIDQTPLNKRRKPALAFFLKDAEYRKSRLDSGIKRQMDELNDHRPYFTCWVTFVQVVCYLFAVSAYDVAPYGVSFSTITEEVLMPNLALEESSYEEENNMWFGLRQADLIHMGAKYSACMRLDDIIASYVERDRQMERVSGCCIRLDGSGCYQTNEDNCSYPFGRDHGKSSTTMWKTWMNNSGPYDRSSGSVCQQDPRFCLKPPTPLKQHDWPDDITSWPICEESYPYSTLPLDLDVDHMTCEVTGRPCCVGVKGQCIITTREDCTFKRGYYHDNLALCSQVDCLEEICGMVPFLQKHKPDQIYRLFFSLFIHAGVLHLLVTVVFQLTIMRDLEKLAGSLRIGIIYVVSGIGGCLASVIFLPHLVEAGPSGSQFGLLSCLFVEVIQNRYILKQPYLALLKLAGLMLFLFILGLLPMIDNFAHLFGFLFGFLLSFTLLPYITFNMSDKRNKLLIVVGCLVVSLALLVGLFVIFYIGPIYSCSFCHFINCIPITPSFCRNMNLTKAI